MGGDIAAWAAYKGFEVTLQDREQRFIDAALTRSQELFSKRVKDEAKRPAIAARLKGDLAGNGIADADLVIEAIIEQAAAKRMEGQFTLDDFLEQMQQIKKMGSLGSLMGMMPGMPKVWAAGVKAPDFLPELGGLATTRNDQLLVMPCLHATRDSSSFAVGDCASLKPPATERALPPTAHVADRSDICRFGWAARRLVHLPIRISALWSRWHAMTVRVPLASSVCSPGARSKADGYN